MVLGGILGLGFAIFFGLNSIVVRRGVLKVSVNYIAALTIYCGPVFFFLLTLFTGDLFKIPGFSWKAILFFALSGIIHFALGRTFGYRAVQILGATRAGIMTGLNAVVSIMLAIFILGEKLTPLMVLGICLSLSGPIIVGFKEGQKVGKAEARVNPGLKTLDRKTFYRGVFFGVCSAFLWGSSAIFVKLGLNESGSSLGSSFIGSFIAFSAASLVISTALFSKANRNELVKSDKEAFKLAMMSGLTTNIAQMLRYVALSYGGVIVVSLTSRTIPIWTLILSFIFNRKIESFSRWVLLGNGLLIIGTILVLL